MILGRHIAEGFKNLIRNKWLSVASLISVMITLFIVGVFTVVILNINSMTDGVEKNVEIVVEVDAKAKSHVVDNLGNNLKNLDKVEEVTFVSKKDGLNDLLKDLGEKGKAFESLKEDNPLNDIYKVRTVLPKDTKEVAKIIEKYDGVLSVNYGEDVVELLFKITNMVRTVGIALVLGLVMTALLLIANTVKMSIDTRRTEIQIMRLVGAKNGYIRAPYVIEGALLGLLGSIIPLAAVGAGYSYIYNEFNSKMTADFMQLIPIAELMMPLILLIVAISVIIGALGSAFSITKHLKN